MATSKLLVISAPSGCGKTTIVREILRRHPELKFSVSATSRKQRVNEIHGKDYFFLAKEDFEHKIQRGELVEWERIYDNYYGTLKSEVETALHSGTSMLFDIDVKGALSVRRCYPQDTVLIFIEPPGIEVLRERLAHRRTESEDVIRKRLERVPMELEMGKQFHHRVVNDDLDKAINEVDAIVRKAVGTAATQTAGF